LKRLVSIREAYVIPHPQTPDAVAAALASSLTLDEARRLIRKELAPWKIPRRLVVLTEFPLTARGKIDTAQLREILSRG
jgi:acyl-CoA synthetase (AMP-forming)/AMP-acid ligase II